MRVHSLLLRLGLFGFTLGAQKLRHSPQFDISSPFTGGVLQNYISGGAVEVFPNSVQFGKKQPNLGGAIWSKSTLEEGNWQATLKLRVNGQSDKGGDGMGLWYTKDGFAPGPVMGAPDKWIGLGLLIDTYDNDNRNNNPAIMGIMNDGSKSYKANQDGEGQYFGGCIRGVRNLPVPLYLRVTYLDGNFSVEIDDAQEGMDYIMCFEKKGLQLPTGYHFGISGGNNNYPDSMEIFDFKILSSPRSGDRRPVEDGSKRGTQQQPQSQQQQQQYFSPPPPQAAAAPYQPAQAVEVAPFQPEALLRPIEEIIMRQLKAAGTDKILPMEANISRFDGRLNRIEALLTEISHHLENSDNTHLHEAISNVSNEVKSQLNEVKQSAAILSDKAMKSHAAAAAAYPSSSPSLAGGQGFFGNVASFAIFLVLQVIILSIFLTVKQRMDNRQKKYL